MDDCWVDETKWPGPYEAEIRTHIADAGSGMTIATLPPGFSPASIVAFDPATTLVSTVDLKEEIEKFKSRIFSLETERVMLQNRASTTEANITVLRVEIEILRKKVDGK